MTRAKAWAKNCSNKDFFLKLSGHSARGLQRVGVKTRTNGGVSVCLRLSTFARVCLRLLAFRLCVCLRLSAFARICFTPPPPTNKATTSKPNLRGLSLSEYGSEVFRVRLRRLSEYSSDATLVGGFDKRIATRGQPMFLFFCHNLS